MVSRERIYKGRGRGTLAWQCFKIITSQKADILGLAAGFRSLHFSISEASRSTIQLKPSLFSLEAIFSIDYMDSQIKEETNSQWNERINLRNEMSKMTYRTEKQPFVGGVQLQRSIYNASPDLVLYSQQQKHSKAYVRAMKSLQDRIIELQQLAERYELQIGSLQEQLSRLRQSQSQKLKNLMRQLDGLKSESSKYRKLSQSLSMEKRTLESRLQSRQSQLQNLKRDLSRSLKSDQAELARVKVDLQRSKLQLEQENDTLRRQADKLVELSNQSQKKLKGLIDEIRDLNEKLNKQKQLSSSLKLKLESAQKEGDSVRSELHRVKNVYGQSLNMLKDQQRKQENGCIRRLNCLEEEIVNFTEKWKSFSGLGPEIRSLELEIDSLQRMNDQQMQQILEEGRRGADFVTMSRLKVDNLLTSKQLSRKKCQIQYMRQAVKLQ